MWTKFLKLFFPCLVQEEKTKPKSESVKKAAPIKRKSVAGHRRKNLNTGQTRKQKGQGKF